MLRRGLINLKPVEAARKLVELLEAYPTNAQLLADYSQKMATDSA
jgi:transcription termination factor Rho